MRFFISMLLFLLILGESEGQLSLQRFEYLSDEGLAVGIVENNNVFIKYDISNRFSGGVKSTIRFERLESNYFESFGNVVLLDKSNLLVNLYGNAANQYFVYNSWKLGGNLEVIAKFKRLSGVFDLGYVNIDNQLTYNALVAYSFSDSYTLYSSIGQHVEYNYLFESFDIGLNIKKDDFSIRLLVRRFKENGIYFKRNTRLSISFALQLYEPKNTTTTNL